jgi:hypothetical protein
MYEVGRVYIWQNCTGDLACLNGTETIVLEAASRYLSDKGRWEFGCLTDTQDPLGDPEVEVYAEPGDLRPKYPPSGEQSVLDLFKRPELEPA